MQVGSATSVAAATVAHQLSRARELGTVDHRSWRKTRAVVWRQAVNSCCYAANGPATITAGRMDKRMS